VRWPFERFGVLGRRLVMRILHFLQYFLPAIGGGVKFVAETGVRLVTRGHSVRVICSTALENVGFMSRRRWEASHYSGPKRSSERGVEVWRYDPTFLPAMDRIPLLTYGPILPGVVRDLGRMDTDLIHTSAFPYAHNSHAWLVSRMKDVPLVVTPYLKPALPVSPTQRRILREATRILVPVEWERRQLCSLFGVQSERVGIVPSGVDHRIYRPLEVEAEERYILFVGRLTEAKGVRHLAVAFQRYLKPKYPDVKLLIVGRVSDWARRALPADGSIIMRGPILDEHELARTYASSEIVCYPSRDDCFPHVFLEAWSAGKPVVGCPVGGVSEVIEDYSDGLFARFGDPVSIAEKLEFLLDNPSLSRRMGRRGRRKVLRRYTWDRVTDLLEANYLRVVG